MRTSLGPRGQARTKQTAMVGLESDFGFDTTTAFGADVPTVATSEMIRKGALTGSDLGDKGVALLVLTGVVTLAVVVLHFVLKPIKGEYK